MSPWGGFGGREQIYGRRCAALVLVSQPPPRPPVPAGRWGGVLGQRPWLAHWAVGPARSRLDSPRAGPGRAVAPAPPASPSMPRGVGPPRARAAPAFHRAAPARPFRRRPGPPAPRRPPSAGSASMPRGVGPPRATPPPAFGRAALACPFRAGPRPARALARRRPGRPPGRPWPSRRGLHRAASMRPARLIIHIFTVPEIPYFTGFSSRQAR